MNFIDKNLLFAIIATCFFGLIMVLSASYPDHGFTIFYKQLFYVALSLMMATIIIFTKNNLNSYTKNKIVWLYVAILIMLSLVWFWPISGNHVNGATRWLTFPGGVKLQPAEFAKLSLIIVLASALQTYKIHNIIGTILTLFILFPIALLLMLQPDVGTTLLLIVTSVAMVFVAGTRMRYLIIAVIILAAIIGIVMYLFIGNRIDRILAFHSGSGEMDAQRASAMLGIFRGGFFGVGIGNSLQKMGALPEAHNDMILAIIGEETGSVGMLLLLLLFAFIYYKGFKISRDAINLGRSFESYVAFGISALLITQTLLNFSVNLSLVPPKGITLPLISYGGSSILVTIIMLAILIKIDIENKKCKQF